MCLGEEDLRNPDVHMKGENEVGGRVLPTFRVLISRISQNPTALVEPAGSSQEPERVLWPCGSGKCWIRCCRGFFTVELRTRGGQ